MDITNARVSAIRAGQGSPGDLQDLLLAILNGTVPLQVLDVDGNAAIGAAVTDTLGFYGVTPVVQQSHTDQSSATVVAYTTTATTTNLAAALTDTRRLVNRLRDDLVSVGLIKGAT